MKSKEVKAMIGNTGSVKFLVAVGGNGVKNASQFVLHCISSRKNLGKIVIFIHDGDRTNGDCDQLKKVVRYYRNAHVLGRGKIAATEIILEEENLADFVASKKIGSIISSRDPRKVLFYASQDQKDLELDLSEGQYGSQDVGAINNMVRTKIIRDAKLVKLIRKHLADGQEAVLCTTGSITGGTGGSYAVDDAMQVREIAVKENVNGNLFIGTVLMGPCTSNPEPTEEQLNEYGEEYVVSSEDAFLRTASSLFNLHNTPYLLPDNPDENGNFYLNRLIYAGNVALDPGQKEWSTKNQEVHPYHFLHYMLAYSILDFFTTYKEEREENDSGVRTIRLSEKEEALNTIGWENLPAELKSEVISMMRFCYIFRSEIIPLFSLNLEELANNAVTRKWFTEGFRHRIWIQQTVLDQIINKITTMNGACEAYMKCFHEIQKTTQLGTGREVVQLFNQNILEDHLKTDFDVYTCFEITEEDLCVPDQLTDGIVTTLETGLDGSKIMYKLAEDAELAKAIKETRSMTDPEAAAREIVKLIVEAVYKISVVLV